MPKKLRSDSSMTVEKLIVKISNATFDEVGSCERIAERMAMSAEDRAAIQRAMICRLSYFRRVARTG